ncbi:MAG: hypothetical protein AUI36_04030 [Cyanobacteria bacterium 13_1_40CM_2_61_4]|nr:MAG: hypothetical protein AUI36_04030 [Cyanobacteria bacterium 13_1_40CM_2_61_4]
MLPTEDPGLQGWAVAGTGDWNRDGFPDFIITAPWKTVRYHRDVGASYLIYGGPNLPGVGLDTEVGTSTLPGLTILGARTWGQLGIDAEGGGDLDGDGKKETLIVANQQYGVRPPFQESSIYVFYGDFTTLQAFSLLGLEPVQGSTEGGQEVALQGTGFQGDERVLFGGSESPKVNVRSSVEILAVVPPSTKTGGVDVKVTSSRGSAILPGGFEYVPRPQYPDLVLDPEELAKRSYRTFTFQDFPVTTQSETIRQFASPYFADLNADGIDDLVISAQWDGPGQVTIIFGGQPLPQIIALGETQQYGTVIVGEPDTYLFGVSLAFPGDLNGDGLSDLVVGGALDNTDSSDSSGRSYVIFGRREWPETIDIGAELQTEGAIVIRNPSCGHALAAAPGDMDGDGHPDIVLGQVFCEGAAGKIKIFSGGLSIPTNDPQPTTLITGDPTLIPFNQSDFYARQLGDTMSEVGDVNGDKTPDLVVGSDGIAGEAFLVLGKNGGFGSQVSINDLEAKSFAVRIRRELSITLLGRYLSAAGDFNGDGLSDTLLGLPLAGAEEQGESYVLLGSRSFGNTITDLDLRDIGPWRVQIDGEFPEDRTGWIQGIGDWNADGFSDIFITGAPRRNKTARGYVVFGEASPPVQINLSSLGARGFQILGMPGNWFSGAMHGAASGDFDNDGHIDIAVGEMTPEGKRVVVIYGPLHSIAEFVRGEVNGDGRVDLSDAVAILSYLFLGGKAPVCLDAADVNDNGNVDLSDSIFLLGHLFLGTPAPPLPYPSPGQDPTPDSLGC